MFDTSDNSSVPFPTDLQGFSSQRLLTLAGESLIDVWQNYSHTNQALLYTAGSIFNNNFAAHAQFAFGEAFDVSKAQALGADILGGNYGVLPEIKFLSNAEMNGANGAYAKSTNTIYLNNVFLTENASDPTAVGKVLVEETGHFLDAYASAVDSPGDEGDILAWLTNGEEICLETLQKLKFENDHGIVLLNHESLEVEQASVGTVDLIIEKQTTPSSATVGSSVTISANTKNNGTATAASSSVRYWLSNNTTLDKNDISIGSQLLGSLAAGASQSNTLNFTYNSAWGTGNKYILFQADAYKKVAESNESNNISFAAITITQNRPDLIIENQTTPSSATVGSTISISAKTKNNGTATAASSSVRYWLSDNTTLDSNDISIGSQSLGSLAAGTSQSNSLSFTYNSAWGTGNKYILFQADGYSNVVESNESNNISFAAINITATSGGDWYSQYLQDAGIVSLTRSLAGDGSLSRNDMISLFRDAKDNNVIESNELKDFQTILSNYSRFNMAEYVRVLSDKIVNGNVANQFYKGGTLGNLYAGSSATVIDNLIDKWFLGGDRPTAPSGYTFTYQQASGSLFGNDGTFSYQDIQQGYLGDCYFLTSLGSIALQRPSVIENMFINNGDGTFTVKLYGQNNGTVTVTDYLTVDQFLPTNVSANGYTGQRFALYDNSNIGLWVALAEKAYAQFSESGLSQRNSTLNSYGSIVGGLGYQAMPSIAGVSATYYANNTTNSFPSLSTIANLLSSGKALTADTNYSSSSVLGKTQNNISIYSSHEYMILSADVTNNMLTLRNPWARKDLDGGSTITISYNDFWKYYNIVNVA